MFVFSKLSLPVLPSESHQSDSFTGTQTHTSLCLEEPLSPFFTLLVLGVSSKPLSLALGMLDRPGKRGLVSHQSPRRAAASSAAAYFRVTL